ncbi:hypothetical protein BJV78DRAFT_1277393 [Lactifluus subvellereus]|nr:hypothetical protein BJV78DRAFT_1277393 [Lactifluus subvellereus]
MSPQDKATIERHARTLRELVKRPENRACADCKHNDPRWASWNIGVFLCIRCSGIHRGMGTHISRVKSIDLDAWTPEQMENIQKWGNHLANLYWEAHLKPGHVPPDHKMESFIRSKYESRRWAMDGPPPSDPGVLEGGPSTADTASEPSPASTPGPRSLRTNQQTPRSSALCSNRHTCRHDATFAATPATLCSVRAGPGDIPTSVHSNAPKKDTKQDILSLFSAPAAPSPWTQAPVAQSHPQPLPPFSNATDASSGTDWNVGHNWSNPVPPMQPNVWGATTTQQPSLLGSGSDIWGGSTNNSAGANVGPFGPSKPTSNTQPNKEDVFGDIWGSFK